MEFMNTKGKTRQQLLDFLTAQSTADDEGAVDKLMGIFHPVENREKMGKVFTETLGYNPITMYDIKDIIAIVDDAIGHTDSPDVGTVIEKNREAITKRAMEIFESERDGHLRNAVAKAMAEYLSGEDLASVSFYLTGDETVVDDARFSDESDEDDDDIPDIADDDEDDEDDSLDYVTGDEPLPRVPEMKFGSGDEDVDGLIPDDEDDDDEED